MIVAFADAVGYRTYWLHSHSQKYSGNVAARPDKLTKSLETITKSYKFIVSDPVTILFFLGQLKRTCDSNAVSGKVAMWLLPVFMVKSLTASLTIN